MADLEDILQQLHDSEINAGVQTFFDAGMRVWIGDELNGIQAEAAADRLRAAGFLQTNTERVFSSAPCLPHSSHGTAVNSRVTSPSTKQPGLRSWLIVLGGSMAASPSVVALPWYARGDYPALLKLFSDSNRLPATFDAWLENAERVEGQFQKAGFGIAKIWIRPVPFAAWCRERNVSPDQTARLIFVNETVSPEQ